MSYNDILKWLTKGFGYPVPAEYLSFLQEGDFVSTARMFYIIDRETETLLEISDWFTYDNLISVYRNCCDEKMIEKHHLPIFDSCACTVVIDCNPNAATYGQIFVRTPMGHFDEALRENVCFESSYVAKNFSAILSNLHTIEDLEKMGID
jgi:hypothetical protein